MSNDAGPAAAMQPTFLVKEARSPRETRMMVTPEMAAAWVSPTMNPRNRRAKKGRVDYFVSVIETGQYKYTGEPVQFSGFLDDGTAQLRNGQHRLIAIVRTGQPQTMLVVEGIDDDVMPYLDTGARRSFADNLEIRGISNARDLAAATGLHYTLSNPATRKMMVTGGGTPIYTHADLGAWFDRHEALIRASLSPARRAKSVFGASVQGVGTAWILLTEHTASETGDVDEFFDRLVTDGPTGLRMSRDKVAPMVSLRRWMTRSVMDKRPRPRATIQTAILIKAWNFEQEGVLIGPLVWKPGAGEDFPDVL